MTCRRTITLTVSTILLLALLLAGASPAVPSAAGRPAPAANAPQQAGDAGRGADFLISTAEGAQRSPDVAYNPVAGEYLVVWFTYNGSPMQNDIYGQRYSGDGLPVGEPIAICTDAEEQTSPAVAYNSTAGEYMVVWSDHWTGMNYEIAGQRVAADGTLVGTGFNVLPIMIGDRHKPDVLYDPNANHYLVVWNDTAGGGNEVEGQLLDNAGSSILPQPIAIAGAARAARAAYNSHRQSYLVVYENPTLQNIYGQAIAADGSLTGAAFVVCDDPAFQRDPDLAFNPTSQEYLVAWADGRNELTSGFDIYGRRLDEDGIRQGSDLAITTATNDQFVPRVVHNPEVNQYLVLWSDLRNMNDTLEDLYGQRVRADGTLADQGNFAISTAAGSQVNPAALYNAAIHQYLVVWEDNRYAGAIGGAGDVYGLRLHWLGLPVGYEFNVTAAPAIQRDPEVAYNNVLHEYLVVWSQDRDDEYTGDIWGQRYSSNGRPVEPPFVIYAGDRDDTWSTVAFNPASNTYLVAWTDQNAWDVWGQLLTAQCEPTGSPFTISDNGVRPAIAYGAVDQRYLVIFNQLDPGVGWDIYGRYVERSGLMPAAAFAICDAAGDQGEPDVAYNALGNNYEAVWSDGRTGSYDIRGRVVYSDGSTGPEVTISQATEQSDPVIAWNGDDREFLVLWEDWRNVGGTGVDLYAQRLDANSDLLGTNMAMVTADGDQNDPYLNYISTNGKYYAGWSDHRNGDTDWDIYGQWINADGTPGSIALPLFRAPGRQTAPAGAFSPNESQGLAIWADGRSGTDKVYGRFGVLDQEPPFANFTRQPSVGEAGTTFTFDARSSNDNATPPGALIVRWDLNSDGTWDTPYSMNKVITRTVTLPGTYDVTLGVWDLMLMSSTVTYPILVITATANTPPVAALAITPDEGPPGTAFTLDASASTDAEDPGALTARWDWENDGHWDTDWGTLSTAMDWGFIAGDYTARVEVQDPAGLTDAAISNYRVVPGAVAELGVAPATVMLQRGGAIQFYATAWDEHGNEMENPEVTWSVLDPDAGMIDAAGVFAAGSQLGTFTSTVQAESITGITATASVIVYQGGSTIYLPIVIKSYHPVVETELAYDDGAMDSTASWEVGKGYAACFTPPGGAALILRARYYVQLPSSPIEVHIWDAATHADLLPAPFQGNPWQDGWNDIELSQFNLTVTSDFCVGFLYLADYQPTLGVDTTAPVDNQSYEIDEAYWELQGYDAMIRVVVTEP
jgi:hypothetical protein